MSVASVFAKVSHFTADGDAHLKDQACDPTL